MKRLILFVLCLLIASPAYAVTYCKRFSTDTAVACYGPDYPPPSGSGGISSINAQDENVGIGTFTTLNAVGAGISGGVTNNVFTITVPGSGTVGQGTTGRIPAYIGPTTIGSPYNNVMDSNGNVGIGTSLPPNKLYVAGTTETQAFKLPLNPVAGYILTSNTVGIGTWMPAPASSGGVSSQWVTNPGVGIGTTVGTVGVGTVASSAKLAIVGNIGIGTMAGDYYVTIAPPSGGIIQYGNLGIGTATPTAMLDVWGNSMATANIAAQAISQGGIDANTITMLAMNGVNGGTSFPDTENTPKTYTANGNSQTSTAYGFVGTGSSGLFDGNGDYLSTPDSADWAFGTGSMTIEFRVRFTGIGAYWYYVDQYVDGNNYWSFEMADANTIRFIQQESGVGTIVITAAWTPVINTDYAVAVVKNSNTYTFYINGVSIGGGTDTSAIANFANALNIAGNASDATRGVQGYMGQLRISNTARYTSNYTPATAPFDNGVGVAYPKLQLKSGSTNLWSAWSDGANSNAFKINNDTSGKSSIVINSSGNVGIGTTTPSGGLTVMNGNLGIGTWVPSGRLIVQGGNTGIGTDNPGQMLDVQGTVRVSKLGSTLAVASGTNGCVGQATLSSGVVTVSTACTPSTSAGIFLTDAQSSILNVGSVTIATVNAGSSFVIQSTNVADGSNVNWFITKTN